jgi:molybdopterin converting factor small subunit
LVVTVRLHTTLQRQTPAGPRRQFDVSAPPGATLAYVLDHFAVRHDDGSILFVINGRQAHPDQVLHDGDEIHLIPALAGGRPSRSAFRLA